MPTVEAYAFLGAGASSFLTGLQWPPPGAWVESSEGAVRACEADQLAWWLDEELWHVELDGDVRALGRALVAPRARLVRQVEEWTNGVAGELVLVCARRVRDIAVAALVAEARTTDAALLASAGELDEIEYVCTGIAGDDSGASVLAGLAADVVLYARDAGDAPRAAGVAAYIAAFALAGGDKRAPDYQRRFDAERLWQAQWLTERLRL